MKWHKKLGSLVLGLYSTILVGCAGGQAEMQQIVLLLGQPKPKLPKSEIAIVATQSTQGTRFQDQNYKFFLKSIDGHGFTAEPTGVELPPGKYTFTYEIRFFQAVAPKMWLNKKWYDMPVSVKKGKQMFVAFDNIEGSSSICAIFTTEDKLFPKVESPDFPLTGNFEHTCVNVGIDLSDSAWIKLIDIPGRESSAGKIGK